jgi:hypothetical protein
MSHKDAKRGDQERLLDAALEFIKAAPEEEFNRLLQDSEDDPIELQAKALGAIDAALRRHEKSKSPQAAASANADPISALTVAQLREAAVSLGVRRQVLAAFREHRVIVDSVPRQFLTRLAAIARTTVEDLTDALRTPGALSTARSFKAEAAPHADGQITFDQLLKDAGHSEAERTELMSEDD